MRVRFLEGFDRWMAAHPVAYATLIVVAACVVFMLFVDLPLVIWLNQGIWLELDPAFRLIGDLGRAEGFVAVAILLWIAAQIVIARQRPPALVARSRWLARHCLLLFAALSATAAITHLLKNVLARLRPRVFFEEGVYGHGQPFAGFPADSFPSGHAQVAFAVAAVLALMAPRWAWSFYLLAVLVGLSRLVNELHYLSDIVASAFISIAMVRWLKGWFLDPARRWPERRPSQWILDGRRRRAQAKASPASTRL